MTVDRKGLARSLSPNLAVLSRCPPVVSCHSQGRSCVCSQVKAGVWNGEREGEKEERRGSDKQSERAATVPFACLPPIHSTHTADVHRGQQGLSRHAVVAAEWLHKRRPSVAHCSPSPLCLCPACCACSDRNLPSAISHAALTRTVQWRRCAAAQADTCTLVVIFLLFLLLIRRVSAHAAEAARKVTWCAALTCPHRDRWHECDRRWSLSIAH